MHVQKMDNMHAQKIVDIISNMPRGTSWEEQKKKFFRREKLAGKLADSSRGCTIFGLLKISGTHRSILSLSLSDLSLRHGHCGVRAEQSAQCQHSQLS